MSRTKPDEHASNPVQHKLEWVGHDGGGYFSIWDREAKEEIKVELPLRFAYLDIRKSVAGFYESVSRGFYSNEIKPFSTEEMHVKYYKDGTAHPVASGTWKELKGEIGGKGAKYCNNVYATLLSGEFAGSLVKLPFVGAAGSEWINLEIKDGESFEITGYDDRKKGRTAYRAPLMEKIEITDDEGILADEHDAALQEFFGAVSAKESPKVEDTPEAMIPADADVPLDDDVPF